MSYQPSCHIFSCDDPGTVRLVADCTHGHRLDDLFCAHHAADKGRTLVAGELNCGECWSSGQRLALLTEVLPVSA